MIFSHVGITGFDGGWIGVDVFFVISGFLITGLLNREYDEIHHVSLLQFYIRRAKRILPASLITIVVVLIASNLLLNSIRTANINTDALWAVGFVSNIHFIKINTDYFTSAQAVSPLQHFWSLAVEEQFYLIWPALFLIISRQHGMRFRGWVILRSQRLLLVATIASALSLMWSISYTNSNPTSAYFSTLTRVWELGFGVLLACTVPHIRDLVERWTDEERRVVFSAASATGLLAILVGSCLLIKPGDPFPGSLALIPVLGAVGIIFGGLNEKQPFVNRLLSIQPLPFIGTISFSLYLWHWPVHVFAEALYPDNVNTTTGILAQLAVILAISLVSYYLIENPTRHLPIGQREPEAKQLKEVSQLPIAALVVMSVSALFLFVVSKDASQSSTSDAQLTMESSSITTPTEEGTTQPSDSAQIDPTVGNRNPGEVLTEWNQNLRDSIDVLRNDGLTSDLSTAVNETRDDRIGGGFCRKLWDGCTIGSRDATHSVALIGDSHAQMVVATVAELFPASRITAYARSACPTARTSVVFENSGEAGQDIEGCNTFRDQSINEMLANPPDVLIISDAFGKFSEKYRDEWVNGQSETYDRLMALPPTTTIIHLTTTPGSTETSWENCLGSGSSLARCFTDPSPAYTMQEAQNGVQGRYPRVKVLDLLQLLCDGQTCPPAIDGVPVYIDGVHFTEDFRLALAPALGALMAQEFPELAPHIHIG